MDNQHQQIKGYRDLSQDEIDLMNELKAEEEKVAELYRKVADLTPGDNAAGRWASIGRTEIETGFMFLLKAVARPTNGLGQA